MTLFHPKARRLAASRGDFHLETADITIAYHAAETGKPVSPSLLLTVKEIATVT